MAALFTIQSEFRYEIVRKIFEGGMGIVYEAEQHGARDFVKRVAMKVVRQSYANQKNFIENFIGEAKLVADLIHTNIVQTYHLGEARGIYFIAMEFIRGVNLEQFTQQLTDKHRVLPTELGVFIASRIARGLSYAHMKADKNGRPLGIVHRDVSFKNIMIAFEGDVKLTDFGIAKARGFLQDDEGEVVAGKADYMSPEQADFQITDKRSDIFSAGVVLAHLLLGYNIFKGPSPDESRDRIMNLTIPDFPSIITTTRQRRISLSIVLQSLSQLEERYGPKGAQTIIDGGIASRLFFSGMDIDTATMLSRTIGEARTDHLDALGRPHTSREPVMSAASLRAMPDTDVLYLFANKRPTLLSVTPYYRRSDFAKRAEQEPRVLRRVNVGVPSPVAYVPL